MENEKIKQAQREIQRLELDIEETLEAMEIVQKELDDFKLKKANFEAYIKLLEYEEYLNKKNEDERTGLI